MNGRNRVFSALDRKETSRVPVGEIGGGYTDHIIRQLLDDTYSTTPDSYFQNHCRVREHLGADIVGARVTGPDVEVIATHESLGTPIYRDFWGAAYTQPPNSTVQLVEPIVSTPEELDKWIPPVVHQFDKSLIKRFKTDTEFFVLGTVNAGFDLGYELLGFERFMMWVVQEPAIMAAYFDKLIQTNLALAKMSCDAGADAILIADDLAFNTGTFVDPSFLRAEYFPLLKAMVGEIQKKGLPVFLHSDGDLRNIIPDLIDCGIDVLQSCDPNANMNIPSLKSEYGKDLVFMGNIDIDLLAKGTQRQVEIATRELIHDARKGGGFILSASNVVASYCIPENVRAMYATAHSEILDLDRNST